MISLSTSAFYDQSLQQLSSLRTQGDTLNTQIGTGNRLTKSSDDPVAAAQLRTLSRDQRLAKVDDANSALANSDLGLADSAMSSATDIVTRAKELAVAAANGTLGTHDRATIGNEIADLRLSLLAIANGRNTSGNALFGGQATGDAYSATGAYIGTSSVDPVDLGDGQTVTSSLAGPDVFGFNSGGTATDLFKVLGTLADTLQNGSADDQTAAATTALTQLDDGLNKLTTAQTVIGSRMNWIDLMGQRRETNNELIADRQSAIGGTDLATAMSKLQELSTVLEAAQASFVKLSSLTLFDAIT